MKRFSIFLCVLPALFLVLTFTRPVFCSSEPEQEFPPPYPEIPRISAKQCLTLLGKKSSPAILIDVRLQKQWEQSKNKLPGAVHENPSQVKKWAKNYDKNRTIILY